MFDPLEMIMVRRALYAAGVLPNHILMRISTDGKREMVYSAEQALQRASNLHR